MTQLPTRVGVVGCGLMGSGIAEVAARAGRDVAVVESDAVAAERGLARIERSLATAVARGKLSEDDGAAALDRIDVSHDLDALADRELVIEAVFEDETAKVAVFERVDKVVEADDAVLASNTSSIPIMKLAMATRRPESVVGLHFFNPVPVMELLEIVRGLRTTDEAIADARAFGTKIGKRPIVVKDSPGFATSRLGVIVGVEAIRMLEAGVASAEDIDLAMELGYRHPMGPLKLGDLVGLDVRLAILEHLHKEVGEQFRPPALLRQMVRAGKLGRKTGEGFYKYPSPTDEKKK